MDVFNLENPNEWGPEALNLFEELELGNEGYERGDLFYKRHGGETVAFLHYCSKQGIIDLLESCGFIIVHVPIEESALRGGDKPVFSLSSNFHTTKEVKPENISN